MGALIFILALTQGLGFTPFIVIALFGISVILGGRKKKMCRPLFLFPIFHSVLSEIHPQPLLLFLPCQPDCREVKFFLRKAMAPAPTEKETNAAGNKTQQADIYYRFIGCITLPEHKRTTFKRVEEEI